MAAKRTTYNFNAIRPVIVIAHNKGNKKAISKDMVDGAGIDENYFVMWKTDVEALRKTVCNYVQKWKNQRFDDSISDEDVLSAKNMIYPKWKEILHAGEEEKTARELHVRESDIDALIGFSWTFMATDTKGTVEVNTSETVFRKYVEALLGCTIAMNKMLTDDERDTLDKYQKAIKKVKDGTAAIENLKKEVEGYEKLKLTTKAPEFIRHIDNLIRNTKDEIQKNEEKVKRGEAEKLVYGDDAKKIEEKLKTIK